MTDRAGWAVFAWSLAVATAACQPAAPEAAVLGVGGPASTGPLTSEQATSYLLSLVNRDRAAEQLPALKLDLEATRAAERHVKDMVQHGFTAHWGTDGSVPEQRYTEAGGAHMVHENAACFFDGHARQLDRAPLFFAKDLAAIEHAFISETPPNDGHRRNILRPWHTHVGLALAKPNGIPQACLVQEFLGVYGEYDRLPARARVGEAIVVSGRVIAPVKFGAVGLARINPAGPMTAAELHKTSSYLVPDPALLYFPEGYETPKPVSVKGENFSIQISLEVDGAPGRYEVSVWGQYPGEETLSMLSLRTIQVTR